MIMPAKTPDVFMSAEKTINALPTPFAPLETTPLNVTAQNHCQTEILTATALEFERTRQSVNSMAIARVNWLVSTAPA